MGNYDDYIGNNMFLQPEVESDSYYLDDSSLPDAAQSSSAASKNIVSERNRRKKLNDRLLALRAVVPNISKMDKASIIKDTIDYIQELHDQERRIQAEMSELESRSVFLDFDQDMSHNSKSKRSKFEQPCDSGGSRSSPVEVLELMVSHMGERTIVVCLTCSKKIGTMIKICEVFESLNLKIIAANIAASAGRLLKTVFVELIHRQRQTKFRQRCQRVELSEDFRNDVGSWRGVSANGPL